MSKVSPRLWWWHQKIYETCNITLINMQHGACDVEAPPWKPWFDSAEEPNILSLLATKLACKTSVRWLLQNGGNWGRLLTAKTRNARGASHQPAFMNCLTTSHMWYLCLRSSRWVKALCSMTPYDWPRWFCWRFWDMVSMVLLIGSWCYSWQWVWNVMTKLCCVASGKWNISRVWLQEFDITYIMP